MRTKDINIYTTITNNYLLNYIAPNGCKFERLYINCTKKEAIQQFKIYVKKQKLLDKFKQECPTCQHSMEKSYIEDSFYFCPNCCKHFTTFDIRKYNKQQTLHKLNERITKC